MKRSLRLSNTNISDTQIPDDPTTANYVITLGADNFISCFVSRKIVINYKKTSLWEGVNKLLWKNN